LLVYVQLNARLISEKELGEGTGGGTMQTQEGEIEYCGLDMGSKLHL
jgi:hypothetical protein